MSDLMSKDFFYYASKAVVDFFRPDERYDIGIVVPDDNYSVERNCTKWMTIVLVLDKKDSVEKKYAHHNSQEEAIAFIKGYASSAIKSTRLFVLQVDQCSRISKLYSELRDAIPKPQDISSGKAV